MGLTWRDGAATLLMGLVVAVVLAVTQGWGWPLLGSYRAGVGVLAVIGWGMCMIGGSAMTPTSFRGPFVVLASVLGSVALVLIVVGLITGARTPFVALAADIGILWMMTTLRHAVKMGTRPDSPSRSGEIVDTGIPHLERSRS